MRRSAVFDLDGTLYAEATMYGLLRALHRREAPLRAALLRSAGSRPGRVAWRIAGRLARRDAFRSAALRTLAGVPYARVLEAVDPYLDGLAPRAIAPAMARLERHRAAGDRLLLASATLDPIAQRVAERLGFDDVVASTLEVEGGVCTGRWADDVRGRKLAALRARVGRVEPFVVVTDNEDDGDLIAEAEHATAVVGPRDEQRWIARYGTRIELLEVSR